MRRPPGLLALLVICLAATRAEDDVAQEAAADAEPAPAPRPAPAPAPKPKPAIKIALDAASFKHVAADGEELNSKTAKFGEQLFSALAVDGQHSVEVTFSPSGVDKPQQAMLMLTAADGSAAYVLAKVKAPAHTITVTAASIEKQLGKQGGSLTATLLLGDPSAPAGLQWQLGTLDLGAGEAAKAGPKQLTAGHQAMSNAQPPIAHMFRPPAKRPAAVVSLAFAAAAVAPLGVTLILLGYVGANTKGLPSGGATLWVLLFHAGLAAMMVLYMLFWTTLNLAQTMLAVIPLALFVVATGYKALAAIADVRLADSGKGAVAAGKKAN